MPTKTKNPFKEAEKKEERRKKALERQRNSRVDNYDLVTKQIDKMKEIP